MIIHSLIRWQDTDIYSVKHFKTREALVDHVAKKYGEKKAQEFREGGNYWTNEHGLALEAVKGKLDD